MNQEITINEEVLIALAVARELCIRALFNQEAEIVGAAIALDNEAFRTFLSVAVDLRMQLLSEEERQSIISQITSHPIVDT